MRARAICGRNAAQELPAAPQRLGIAVFSPQCSVANARLNDL